MLEPTVMVFGLDFEDLKQPEFENRRLPIFRWSWHPHAWLVRADTWHGHAHMSAHVGT